MESEKNIYIHQLVPKIEIKQELCLLETSLTKVKSETEVAYSLENHIKNESISECTVQSEIQGYDHEISTKIEINEEPMYLDRTSTEVKYEPEVAHSSGDHIKNESASECMVQSEADIQQYDHEICTNFEIKQKPIYLEMKPSEMKYESEVIHSSEDHIKKELASEYIVHSSSDIQRADAEIYTKIEIKEEPIYLERTSSEVKSESQKINFKFADLDFHTEECMIELAIKRTLLLQDNVLQEDQELTEVTRLDSEAVWNHESGVNSAGVDKICLKLRENSSPSHEKPNTTLAHRGDITHVGGTLTHKCKFCSKCFSRPSALQTHIVSHGKRPHKCSICNKSFLAVSHLKEHILIHESQGPHKCSICNKNFSAISHLKTHILIHEGKRPHKCSICNKTFAKGYNLKQHILIHEGQRPHKCSICNKSFARGYHLKQHILIHEGKRPYKCNICDKNFPTVSRLKQHILMHESKSTHKCNICNKSFARDYYLKNHILIHEGKCPNKCNICNKSFPTVSCLNRHILIHEGKRPHKCSICNKSFLTVSRLREHILIHEGKRPHKCDICNKSFAAGNYLKLHILMHEDKSPYKCNICNKGFARGYNLKQHILVHEGKKPHKCSICNKSFPTVSHLNRHILIHERPQKCNICGKTFPTVSQLKEHILIHEKGNGYSSPAP